MWAHAQKTYACTRLKFFLHRAEKSLDALKIGATVSASNKPEPEDDMKFNAQSFEAIENSQGVDVALHAARCWVRHADGIEFGIESIDIRHRDIPFLPSVQYVNTGDTYDQTIVRREDGTYALSCWGDELERLEETHTRESDEKRCWYCGEWVSDDNDCHGADPDAPAIVADFAVADIPY
jgi:hypothetical protein